MGTSRHDIEKNHKPKMKNKQIYITLKYAQTLDGRIATSKGSSKWISSRKSREYSHRLRSNNDAVLVGVNTILKDNPHLTVRFVRGRNPMRIIVDSKLRTPIKARIIGDIKSAPVLIATTRRAPSKRIRQFEERGVDIAVIREDRGGKVDIKMLIKALSKRGIKSILVEGGSKILTSFLKNKLADRLIVFITPKIMGRGIEAIGDLGVVEIDRCIRLKLNRIENIDGDFIYTARLR